MFIDFRETGGGGEREMQKQTERERETDRQTDRETTDMDVFKIKLTTNKDIHFIVL